MSTGVTLTTDRPWWASIRDVVPAEARKAAETGNIFWLRELMVLAEHTHRGIGRALHDELLRGRAESWTTLTCITDNQPARDAYPRWGYEVVPRTIKHAEESPVYDPMLLRPVDAERAALIAAPRGTAGRTEAPPSW
jgi:GNAT superfamily N-acetyltransferase